MMRRPRTWESAGTVMYSKISRLSQMWLPVVMTWAPRSKSSSAMDGVMPKPPAAFSPLTTRRSTALVSRTWGRCSRTMWRPAEPKTSPTKRMFTEEVYMVMRWRNAGVYGDRLIGSGAGCVSFLSMAQSGRFQLSVRVLAVLASEPDAMHTSAAIAEALKESAVMVRRTFLLLHKAGLIEQKKGPHGGAKLKIPAKQIGLGDVFEAVAGDWLSIEDKAVSAWIKKVRADAVKAMNEHSLAGVVKRLKKTK